MRPLSVAGIAVLLALAILVVAGIVFFIRRKQKLFVIAPFWTKTGAQTGALLGIAVKDNETNVYIQLSHLDPRYSYTADIGGGVFYLQVKKGSCPGKVNIVRQED